MFKLFEMLNMRVEMCMTEAEFKEFRSSLEANGLTLREITRVPYRDPETVL